MCVFSVLAAVRLGYAMEQAYLGNSFSRMEARFGGILGLCVGYSIICHNPFRFGGLYPKHVNPSLARPS